MSQSMSIEFFISKQAPKRTVARSFILIMSGGQLTRIRHLKSLQNWPVLAFRRREHLFVFFDYRIALTRSIQDHQFFGRRYILNADAEYQA